jgi:two-component system, NarL family, invasion response regulator UvrY
MVAQIFMVEDHPVMLSAYAQLLHREPDLAVCGTAASGEEAVALIPQSQPDLVLVDLSLPCMSGLSLIAQLYQTHPALPILIVSGQEPTAYVMRKALLPVPNVKAYIHKQEIPYLLVATIRRVLTRV